MRALVFYGSVRTNRQGIKAARYVKTAMEKRGHEAILIDPREYDFGLLDFMYRDYPQGEAPAKMKELAGLIIEADGFLVVSGEYNNSIPPALSNLLDHFTREYAYRPAGIVGYSAGRYGGVRAAMQLRMMLATLGMVTIPSLFLVSEVQEAFDDEGRPLRDGLDKSFERFARQFEWYMQALRDARETHGRP